MPPTETKSTPTPAEISAVVEHLKAQGFNPLHKPQPQAITIPEWTPLCRAVLRRLAAQDWGAKKRRQQRSPAVYISTLASKVEAAEEDVLAAVDSLWHLGYILLFLERNSGLLHFDLTDIGRSADAARFDEEKAAAEAAAEATLVAVQPAAGDIGTDTKEPA